MTFVDFILYFSILHVKTCKFILKSRVLCCTTTLQITYTPKLITLVHMYVDRCSENSSKPPPDTTYTGNQNFHIKIIIKTQHMESSDCK